MNTGRRQRPLASSILQSLPAVMDTAQYLWGLTYKYTKDDHRAFEMLVLLEEELLSKGHHEESALIRALLDSPVEQLLALWSARWCNEGFPLIKVEEKYAALLMSTQAKQDLSDLVVHPWPAFAIELPPRMIQTETYQSRYIYVHRTEPSPGKLAWNIILTTESGVSLWRHGLSTEQLMEVSTDELRDSESLPFGVPVEDRDARALTLAGRLVVSTCLAMSDPTNFHEQKKSKGRGQIFKIAKRPDPRVYILGTPVKIDCRPYVQAYMDGRKNGPVNVRFQVRSHWRRVPFGPKNENQRRAQMISSYWKGPEDAPKVIRPHVLR